MNDFEQATQFDTAADPMRARFDLSDQWNVGHIPNGGYLIAAAAKAMAGVVSHSDPLTVTGHYLRPAVVGPAEFTLSVVKQGGTFDNVQTSLHQEGAERCRFMAAFGSLDRIDGPSWRSEEPPEIPPPEACIKMSGGLPINRRYDAYFAPQSAGWLRGESGGDAEFLVWMAHADGRAPDLYSLLLFADGLPPPVFNRDGARGWIPTVELTVHLRAKPAPGLVRCRFKTRYMTRGLLEADGEIWDSKGELVALSRQLARVRN